jgi:hypothetical protein
LRLIVGRGEWPRKVDGYIDLHTKPHLGQSAKGWKAMSAARNRLRSQPPAPDKRHLDQLLDEALEETFPASDPIAIDVRRPQDTESGSIRKESETQQAPITPVSNAV